MLLNYNQLLHLCLTSNFHNQIQVKQYQKNWGRILNNLFIIAVKTRPD